MNIRYITLPFVMMVFETAAGDSTMDTAIGGGIGNAPGAAIDNVAGGR